MVVDDRDRPHADAAIVEALYGFKVEEWDWKRVDLCSDVIHESAPTVKEVSLYCSGNNAVLMGWASAEGLGNRKKFPRLERVHVYVRDGWEDEITQKRNTERCKASIEKYGGVGPNGEPLKVEIVADKNKSFSSKAYNATDGRYVSGCVLPKLRGFEADTDHMTSGILRGSKAFKTSPIS